MSTSTHQPLVVKASPLTLGPIFNREVLTVPRRSRHYAARTISLLVLWLLVLTAWQAAFGWGQTITLGDLAYFGTLAFRLLTLLLLLIVLFLSALFAASAVAQEKDRRTFILLLLTDLRNYEIVLGKLLGSLLEVMTVVACSIPILALCLLFGGIDGRQVLLMFLLLGSSALAAGSLGSLLALWREKTFQTLALTFLTLVLYLVFVEGLAVIPSIAEAFAEEGSSSPSAWAAQVADWQVRLSPYHAWRSVVEPQTEERIGLSLGYEYAGLMVLFAVLMNGWAILRLRKWNPSGEPIQQKEDPETAAPQEEETRKVDIHASPGKPREVWPNPVLWREIRTSGYGRRALLIKAAYLLFFALICVWVYRELPTTGMGDRLLPAWGLVPTFVLALLLLNAQAVTAITSERDLKALELLLVTDLTPRELLIGKLGGIFWNTAIIVLPPLGLACAYFWWGYIPLETLIYVLLGMVVIMAFTAMLGVHVALRNNKTRVAIGMSLGTIFFLFVGTMVSMYVIIASVGFGVQWTSFLTYVVMGAFGMLYVLGGKRPSPAITFASIFTPAAVFYTILNILIGDPRTGRGGDPLIPFLALTVMFSFTFLAMIVPLLSEFEVELGHSTPAEE